MGDAMVKLFHAGGVPAGVLNLVQASGEATFAGLEEVLLGRGRGEPEEREEPLGVEEEAELDDPAL